MFRRRPDTYYDYLAISPHASAGEIAAAYKRSIVSVHPDTVSRLSISPEEWDIRLAQTKQINEAWEILRDPERRATYDAQMGIKSISRWRLAARNLAAGLDTRRAQHQDVPRPARHRPRLVLPPGAVSAWDLLSDSRLGQWLLLGVVALAMHVGGALAVGAMPEAGVLRGPTEIVALAVIAFALSRGGSPTPLFDALTLMVSLDRLLGRILRSAASSASVVVSGGMEQAASAVRANREDGAGQNADEDLWSDKDSDSGQP